MIKAGIGSEEGRKSVQENADKADNGGLFRFNPSEHESIDIKKDI